MGFSSTNKSVHVDANGDHVPSYHASREEVLALAEVLRNYPGTSLEFASEELGMHRNPAGDIELMTEMSRLAGRPINWNTIRIKPEDPEFVDLQLQAHDYSQSHGGRIVGLTNPKLVRHRLCFMSGMPLNGLPHWVPTFKLGLEARKRALADPDVRRELRRAETAPLRDSQRALMNWPCYVVAEAFSATTRHLEGQKIGDIAQQATGREPFDVLLDIVVADDLRTVFLAPEGDDSEAAWRERARVWLDSRTGVGGADAGAHLDQMCGANYTMTLLGEHVRERQLLSLEEAVRQLSDVPARLYGLKDRGRIAQGWHADLVVFDPATVGPGVEQERHDLPAGGAHLYSEATGVRHVFVSGREIVRAGEPLDATPGVVLRSGRDTNGVVV